MDASRLKKIESEDELVGLLKKHALFRENDVTFEDIASSGDMFVYAGDDFDPNDDALDDLEIAAIVVDGSLRVELLSIGDLLPDLGVFCVTGDVRCRDLVYVTESTGVSIGGDLIVDNVALADCANSVLQVNKTLRAKLFFNAQCTVDVRGETIVELDERASAAQLQAMGLTASAGQEPGEIVGAYFEQFYEDGEGDEVDEADEA